MATITSTPTGGNLTVNGTTQVSGTISWSKPTIPSGATIISCVLTGTATASLSKGSATITVNGTTVTSGIQFTINLGTANNTTSVTTTAKGGNKNSKGTVSFSNLVYTVEYILDVPVTGITLSPTNITVQQNKSVIVNAILTPNGSTDEIIWSINDTNIATLTKQASSTQIGINGKTVGEATITATTVKSGISVSEKVIVEPLMVEAKFEVYLFTGSYGNTAQGEKITNYSSIIDVDYSGTGEFNSLKPLNINIINKTYSLYEIQNYNNLNYSFSQLYRHKDIHNNKYIAEYSFNDEVTLKENCTLRIYLFQGTFETETSYTVIFKDWDGTTLKTETVEEGSAATAPSNPARDGYTFTGWDKSFNNITSDLTITAQYTKNGEPEEDIIEWTGLGTVATNIYAEDYWKYKLNMDWDTQYLEISFNGNNSWGSPNLFYYIHIMYLWNDTATSTNDDGVIEFDDEGYSYILDNAINEDFVGGCPECTVRFSKINQLEVFNDGVLVGTFTNNSIINQPIIYLSSHDFEGNTYVGESYPGGTITSIEVKSVEELKENIFPSFVTEEWGTNGTFTILEESDCNIRFTSDAPWSGPLYYAPYYWQGKTITLSCDTMSENTKFDIMTTSWGALFELTPENSPLTVTLPNEPIMFCLQSSSPDVGVTREVYVTGLRITSEDDFENNVNGITGLNINKDIYYVGIGEEINISCTVTPSDGVYGNLAWTTNNPDLSLIEDGKSCIAVSDVIGNYTLTVTDSLTGLSDSCSIVVDDLVSGELFPPFTNGEWYLNSTCTEILKEDYSYSFECTEPWTAISISIPDYWYGKSIEISCENISENAGLYIQETDSWVEIGKLTLSSKNAILHIPNKGDYTDIIIALQAPTTPGIVSITNVTASLYGLDNDEDDSEGDIIEDFYDGKVNLQYENRLIGYKKPDNEEIVEDAIICTNIGEVSRALSSVQPGQTIYLRRGKYVFGGSFIIRAAGTEGNYVTIKGYPGESVIIAETKLEFANPAKYLNFENLIIANVPDLHWGYAMKVHSGTSYINFRNLEIRNITCKIPEGSTETTTGCNPLVIYGDTAEGINNVNVENCYIHDCDTGWSEGLTLNGHVSNCLIKNCTIANITNIGIDLAGNYEWTGTVGDPENQTHDCIVENCLLVNCQSPYATSAGLYSDGARDNTFRYNVMYNCQCGIELGSEQPGAASENFYVHNNLIIDSGRAIGVGSYQETGAPNRNAYIYNNTIICGDSNKENYGLYVERTDNVNFYNNIVYGTSNTTLFSNYYNSNVNIGNNCWYQQNGSKPEIDSTGIFENHIFINNDLTLNGDYSLRYTSPCINKGNSEVFDSEETFDLAGNPRIIGEGIDIGAFEHSGQPEEDPEEDVIEWTGIGTVATGLKAHAGDDGYSHDRYKINLDWENESFDIIITDELDRSSNYFFNFGTIGDIKIGDTELSVIFSDGAITIYCNNTDIMLEYYNSDYGNFPFIISFTKKGIYVKSSANTGEYSTPELLSGSENIYEINQPIYLIDDGLIHSSVSNQENPEYNILFDLAVSEYSEQTEEPEEPGNNESLKLGGNTIDGLYIGNQRIIQMYLNGQQLL